MVKKETYLQCPDVNVFEGMTSISAILENYEQNITEKRTIVRILFDQSRVASKRRELAFLKKMASQYGFEVKLTSSEEIEDKTTGNTHGGIIAECLPKKIGSLTDNFFKINANGFYVMLDGIEDPYNFGYSVRSLYAAGADGIILPERNWMEVAGIVSKSSAGASELIPMFISDPKEAISFFESNNYKIVCSGIRNSISMYDADMKKPLFLIVGGEKRGISASVEAMAHVIARVEYGRDFRGSLSAASAATIMAYEVFRQNR